MRENFIINRRDILTKGFKAAAALGIGAMALKAGGNFDPFATKALARMPDGALDFVATEPCVLTCSATLGPCYFSTGLVRRDITEGKPGLPTRLAFRIVNADTCEPVTNASIDIWHTDNNGIYSAPISAFCNGTDPVVQTQQTTWGFSTDSPIAAYDTH